MKRRRGREICAIGASVGNTCWRRRVTNALSSWSERRAWDGRGVGSGAYSDDKAAVSAQPQQVVDRYRAAPLRLYHWCPNRPVETPTTIGTLGVDERVELRIDDLIAEPGARDA